MSTPALIFRDASAVPPALDAVLVEFQPRTTVNPRGLVVRSRAEITSGVVELAEADWKLGVDLGFTIPSGTEVLVQPNWQLTVKPPDGTTMSGDVRWTGGIERDAAHPLLIVGQVGGTRIEATTISARAGATLAWDGAAGVARATPAAELELARFVNIDDHDALIDRPRHGHEDADVVQVIFDPVDDLEAWRGRHVQGENQQGQAADPQSDK